MSRTDKSSRRDRKPRTGDLLDCRCCEVLSSDINSLQRRTRERTAMDQELIDSDDPDPRLDHRYDKHCFIGHRCVRCGTEQLDASIYRDLEACPTKEQDPVLFRTGTDEATHCSHPNLLND